MNDDESDVRTVGEEILANVHSLDSRLLRLRARLALVIWAVGVKVMPNAVMEDLLA